MFFRKSLRLSHHSLIQMPISVLAILFASCVSLCGQDEKNHQGAPTYMDNFRRLCNQSEAITKSILTQAMVSNTDEMCERLLKRYKENGWEFIENRDPKTFRIGVNDIEVGNPIDWKQFVSESERLTIDILRYEDAKSASNVMDQRGQAHSGTMNKTDACFITIVAPDGRDAVCTVHQRGPFLFGIKRSLPFRILNPGSSGEHSGINTAEERIEVQTSVDLVTQCTHDLQLAIRLGNQWTPPVDPTEAQKMQMRVAGFTHVWSEVKYNFPFFERRLELDWDSVLNETLPQVMAAQSDEEYVSILQETIARLKDGHCWVRSRVAGMPEQDFPPIQILNIEGRPTIVGVAQTNELDPNKIFPGLQITTIDGVDASVVLRDKIYPRICASTDQDRDNRAFQSILRGDADTDVQVGLRDAQGEEWSLKLVRNSRRHKDSMPWQTLPPFEMKKINEDTVYLAFNTFADAQVVQQFDKHFAEIQEFESAIIDLRHNGGGSSSNGYAIISRLITQPCDQTSTWKTRMYRPAHRSWGMAEEWFEGKSQVIQPRGESAFTGPIAVLTGPGTYSAAEDFLVPLHSIQRATLVGEPTGGSTGNPLVIEVHSATVAIVSKWDSFPDGTEFVGKGITPDILVAPSQSDVSEGRDPVLAKGLEHLRKKLDED